MHRVSTTIVTLLLSLFVLTGCNTIEGMGEDIEEAGDEIEDATN